MVKNEYFYLTVEEPVEAPVEAHLQPVPVPFPTTTQRKPTAGMTKVAPPLEDLLVSGSLFVQHFVSKSTPSYFPGITIRSVHRVIALYPRATSLHLSRPRT
eukprot:1176540-Prorocentrum_minimum.AAC.3